MKSTTLRYADFDQLRKKDEDKEPFSLAKLDAFNADIEIEVQRAIAPGHVAFSGVLIDAIVKDGRLSLTPVKFGVGGGVVTANLELARENDRLLGQIDAEIESVDLSVALKPIGLGERFEGVLDADFDFALGPRGKSKGEGEIRYRVASENTDAKLFIDQTADSLVVRGDGSFNGEAFKLSANLGEFSNLVSDAHLPVEIDLNAVDTKASIEGSIANPLQLKNLDLVLNIAGANPEQLFPVLRLNLPDLPPYALSGELSRDGEIWKLANFEGSVGDSVVTGDLSVDTAGDKPFLKARLESPHLDFDDLGPLIGRPPGISEGEKASEQQIAEAKLFAARERVLPGESFNLDRLRTMNADVYFHAAKIEADTLPIDDLTIDLELVDGRMTLKPIAFGVAGGDVRVRAVLNSRPDPAEARIEAEIESVDLARLLEPFEIAKGTRGVIGGEASLSLTGSSFAELFASLDGGAKLLMSDGQLDALLVELAGLDGGESLLAWLQDGEEPVPLRCAFADLKAQGGIVAVERLAIDSTDTRFNIDGSVNLKHETLDLSLSAHPKDMSFLVARSPLLIEGTFKNPEFHVARGGLIARALAALGLFAIAPPAALLALVEPGLGDNAPGAQFVEAMAPGAGAAGPKADD